MALTQDRLAAVFRGTRRLNDAHAASAGAVETLKQLVRDFSDRSEFRIALAQRLNNRAILLVETGRPKEARPVYGEALAIYRQLAAEFPTQPQYRQNLAGGHSNLGLLLTNTGAFKEAHAAFGEALVIQKRLVADYPARPEFRRELAVSQNNLGTLLYSMGRSKEAETAHADARAIYRQLAADFPTRPEFRQELAGSLVNLGSLLMSMALSNEAEAAYVDGLEVQKELATEFPKVPNYRNDLAKTLVYLAILRFERFDNAASRRRLQEALPHCQEALRADPENLTYRQNYRDYLAVLMQTCAAQGDQSAAVQAAATLRDVGWDAPSNAHDAAHVLAACVVIVEGDERLKKEVRQQRMRFFADQSMAMLRDAVAKGWRDAAAMKGDAELDPLRKREDFQKLLAEMEAKAKAK